jgi:hypothetical protein
MQLQNCCSLTINSEMHVSPSRIFAKTKYWNFRGNYRMQPGPFVPTASLKRAGTTDDRRLGPFQKYERNNECW